MNVGMRGFLLWQSLMLLFLAKPFHAARETSGMYSDEDRLWSSFDVDLPPESNMEHSALVESLTPSTLNFPSLIEVQPEVTEIPKKKRGKKYRLYSIDGKTVYVTGGILYDHLESNPANGWVLKNLLIVRFSEERIPWEALKMFSKMAYHQHGFTRITSRTVPTELENRVTFLEIYAQYLIISRKLDFCVEKFFKVFMHYSYAMPDAFLEMLNSQNFFLYNQFCLGSSISKVFPGETQ